ncbi:MAG: hypothetical protein Fues2KO_25280 [Fuerstiella sp.]
MAQTDIFLAMSKDGFKIGDTDFGTSDVRCPGAIEVLSYSHTIQQIGAESGGRPRSVEDVSHGDFEIEKAVDAFSPLLFHMCCSGTYIAEAKVLLYSAGGGWSWSANKTPPTGYPPPFLEYTMSYVHISYVSPSGGSGIPTEKIGLKYGQMRVKHLPSNTQRDWSLVMEAPVKLFAGSDAGDHKTQ